MKKTITIFIAMVLTLLFSVSAKADINYNLLYEWSQQPTNVQYSLANQGTIIKVTNDMPETYLFETWAVTNTYVYPGTKYVLSTEILLLPSHEDCLTHEVGHAISHYNRIAFFWCDNSIWNNIYNTESHNQIIYPQGWDNPQEYFACCYEEYMRFPIYMKKLQPSSYNYIKVMLSYQ